MNECDRQAAALENFVALGGHRDMVFGDQWGPTEALRRQLVDEWILPSAQPGCTALEIGCGGGRWTRYFCDRVALAWLVDATPAAEQAVLAHCDALAPLRFLISEDGSLPEIAAGAVNWAWSFDTFVHFHAELFDRYVREVARVLRPGGLLHLHYAVAWPGLSHDAECFQYRQPNEVETLLAGLRLYRTGRRVEYRSGFGSLLQEFRSGVSVGGSGVATSPGHSSAGSSSGG